MSRRLVVLATLLLSVVGCGSRSGTDLRTATVEPINFTTASGDSLYLTSPRNVVGYGGRYLVVNDPPTDEVWILDVDNGTARMIGTQGDGPGEYRMPQALTVVGDTLWVFDAILSRIVKYLLPEGRAVGSVHLQSRLSYPKIIPLAGGEFLAAALSFSEREAGLYGRYSASGELIEAFGHFQLFPDYELLTRAGLEHGMNSGILIRKEDGGALFVYTRIPKILIGGQKGSVVDSARIDMPWLGADNRENANPQYSEILDRLYAKPLLFHAVTRQDGILVVSSDSDSTQIVAQYGPNFDLRRVVRVPGRPGEEYLLRLCVMGDRLWGLWDNPPFVRRISW